MSDKKNIALLIIDAQNDFSENRGQTGSLYVPGAVEDFERASNFILENLANISEVFLTYDTHSKRQIFHPVWWIHGKGEKAGQHPEPFTIITSADVQQGIFKPVIDEEWSASYLYENEKAGHQHIIWPYHCINGTWGHQLQQDINGAVNAWSISNKKSLQPIYKGYEPRTEFYGIFKAQVPDKGNTSFNNDILGRLNNSDSVIVFGQAMSHCVGLSIRQLLDEANNGNTIAASLLSKITLLSDCCSYIPGFKGNMDDTFKEAEEKYGFKLAQSTEVNIKVPIETT